MKHITHFLRLAAAIICSMVICLTAFAESPNGLSVSNSAPARADVFQLNITIPPAENADTASIKVTFDSDAFEVTSWSPKLPGGFSNFDDGFIALSAANADRDILLGDGMTFTADIKVSEYAKDGVYSFVLSTASVCYFDPETADFTELWFPETKTVTVTIGSGDTAITTSQQAESVTTTAEASPAETTVQNAPVKANSDSKALPVIVVAGIALLLIIALVVIARLRK